MQDQLKVSNSSSENGRDQKKQIAEGSIWDHYQKLYSNEKSLEKGIGNANSELEIYLNMPLEPATRKVMEFWQMTSLHPSLKELAKKYMCVPPATVFSERLFSTAGIICDSKRNRLDPERVKMLVFLKKNLPNYK